MPGDVWSLLGMLAVAILILAAAYWVTKWIGTFGLRATGGAVGAGGPAARGSFCVLGRLSLGRGEQLVLVRLGAQCYLLGVAAGHVTLLKELDAEQSQEWLSSAETVQAPGFLDVLKDSLRKRK